MASDDGIYLGMIEVERAVRATVNINLLSLIWDNGRAFDSTDTCHAMAVTTSAGCQTARFSCAALDGSQAQLSIEAVREVHAMLVRLRAGCRPST